MSRVLVITGMHRSGTSLVASLFERAGLNLGSALLAPGADNPLGYFEDAEFVRWHEEALHARRQTILASRDFTFTPTDAEAARADELIAARAAQPLWGWKDPRTCLFLDFWSARLPAARYLFVYRHPFDVLLSLARRGEVVGFDFYSGLEAWYTYNARLEALVRAKPHETLLCNTYALLDNPDAFGAELAQKFGIQLELNRAVRDSVYQAERFKRTRRSAATETLLAQIHPDAIACYERLQKAAFLPDESPLDAAPPQLEALAQFAAQLPAPLGEADQRALLPPLVALTDAALFVEYSRGHVAQTAELERQRRAWQATAEQRELALNEQAAWAEPRLNYLTALESNALVRALIRLGLAPRDS